MPTVYGLKTCDTCRKAIKALEAAAMPVTFQDVRAEPLTEAQLSKYLELFGDTLVNTRSTTWRGLSDAERAAPPLALLLKFPALMKRPVIDTGSSVHLGWSQEVQNKILG